MAARCTTASTASYASSIPVDQRGFDPADLDAADQLLAGFTSVFEPKRLRDLAHQIVERIDPDGTLSARSWTPAGPDAAPAPPRRRP